MSRESDFQAAKARFFMAKKAKQEAALDWAKWSRVFCLSLVALFLAVLAWASPGAALGISALLILMPVLPGIVVVAVLFGLFAIGPKHKDLL